MYSVVSNQSCCHPYCRLQYTLIEAILGVMLNSFLSKVMVLKHLPNSFLKYMYYIFFKYKGTYITAYIKFYK